MKHLKSILLAIVLATFVFSSTVFSASAVLNEKDYGYAVQKNQTIKGYVETYYALGSLTGATNADIANGNVQSFTVGDAFTLTLTNPPAGVNATSITFIITNGAAHVLTWDPDIDWPGGTAAVLTASGVDIIWCFTVDGGTIWHCGPGSLDSK